MTFLLVFMTANQKISTDGMTVCDE